MESEQAREPGRLLVSFMRSGGFAGMQPPRYRLAAESLPPEAAEALRKHIEEARFFELPSVIPSAGGADRFQYEVTVETDERRHTVRTTDGVGPDALQDLIRLLVDLARSGDAQPDERRPASGESASGDGPPKEVTN